MSEENKPEVEIAGLNNAMQDMRRKIEQLERTVNTLCVTNFMTEHKDGDEEIRNFSVAHINRVSNRYKDNHKAMQEYGELERKVREMQDRMMAIKLDNPQAIPSFVKPPLYEEAEKMRKLNEYMNKQYYANTTSNVPVTGQNNVAISQGTGFTR